MFRFFGSRRFGPYRFGMSVGRWGYGRGPQQARRGLVYWFVMIAFILPVMLGVGAVYYTGLGLYRGGLWLWKRRRSESLVQAPHGGSDGSVWAGPQWVAPDRRPEVVNGAASDS